MIQYSIHLPRLCDRVTLAEIGRLHPVSLSVTENEAPLSTAQMDLPMEDYAVQVGQFVELYDAARSLGFYRISEVQINYKAGRMQTVYMEHGISTLANDVIFGAITYTKGQKTARAVMDEILGQQSQKYWELWTDNAKHAADLAYLDQQSEEFQFEDQDLLQALLDCAASLQNQLTLIMDMSRFPWKVLPVAVPTVVTSEARLSRNIESLRLGYDWSALCTRIYPKSSSGESAITIKDSAASGGKMYIDSDTQGQWGVISHIWEADDAASADVLYNKAAKRLEEVKNPIVSITLDGHDLSGLTGEPLDSFEVGQPCRITIPEDGINLALRILTIQHSDLVRDPSRVSMTIGTADRRKVSRQRAQSAGGGGGPGPRKKEKDDKETYSGYSAKSEGDDYTYCGGFTISTTWTELTSVSVSITLSNIKGDPTFDLYVGSTFVKTMRGGTTSVLEYLPYSGSKVRRGVYMMYLRNIDPDASFDIRYTTTVKGKKPASGSDSE